MIPFEYSTIIELGGFKITEPVTTITDLLIAVTAFCICHFFKKHVNEKHILLWNFFFFFMAVSTLIGALSHGLKYYFNERVFIYFWLSMHISSGIAMHFAQRATIEKHAKHSDNEAFYGNLIFLQIIVYVIAVFLFKNFVVVVINTFISLFPILVIGFRDYFKNSFKSSLWLAIGISINFFPAIINGAKISLGEWFNYKDISHVLIAISISVMAYGILLPDARNKKQV